MIVQKEETHVDQVYQAIVTNAGSFRLALVVALISAFLFVMAAWGLYVLLRPVNEQLALLFLLLNAIGVAIQCASMSTSRGSFPDSWASFC